MWAKLEKEFIELNLVSMNSIPHFFKGDAKVMSVSKCLELLKKYKEGPFPKGLFPIYGVYNSEGYDRFAEFLLVEPKTGKFYELYGGYSPCYGFKGNFEPTECPIKYLVRGGKWGGAYETVLKVMDHFKNNTTVNID